MSSDSNNPKSSKQTEIDDDDEFVGHDQVEVVEQDVEQDYEGIYASILIIFSNNINFKDDLAEGMIEVEMDDLIEVLEREKEEEDDEEIETDEHVELQEALTIIDKHEKSVFCVDSYQNLYSTGGEDDLAMLWRYDSQAKKFDHLFTTDKFKDSVTNIKFSHDGKYLAVADMGGLIRVYLLENNSVYWSHDLETDIEQVDWHPGCNVLFCSTADGYFYMLKISSNEIKLMYSGDTESLSRFRILKDGKRAVCCYNNGAVRIWDLKSAQAEHSFSNAHENEILALDLSSDGSLIATAGMDMKIHLINATNGKFISYLEVPKVNESNEDDSVESVVFCKSLPLLACATLSGHIIVWDLNTRTVRSKYANANAVGYTKLAWNSQTSLYASTVDGTLQIFDGRNLTLIKQMRCHKSEILDFCLNQDSSLALTASNESIVKLFAL